jgi:hypothetical protein
MKQGEDHFLSEDEIKMKCIQLMLNGAISEVDFSDFFGQVYSQS